MSSTQTLDQATITESPIPLSGPAVTAGTASVPAASGNLIQIASNPSTANDAPLSASTRLWSVSSNARAAPAAPASSGGAKGVILHVTSESVRCEILHGVEAANVWLPRALFPDGATPGYTFEITMETQNGYRAPCVKPRAPDDDPLLADRLAAIQAEFG